MKIRQTTIWRWLFGPNRVVTCPWCKKRMRTAIMEGEVQHLMCDAKMEHFRKEREQEKGVEIIRQRKREQEAADRRQIELYKQAMREMKEEQS